MAQHKAPTQVTVVEHEERSAFREWVDRHWLKGAVLAVAASAVILVTQYSNQQAEENLDAEWDQLNAAFAGQAAADPASLDAALADLAGTAVEPWGALAQVRAYVGERRYDEANQALEHVRRTGVAALTEDTYPIGASGAQLTLADRMAELIAAQAKWEAEHPSLFVNPLPPEDGLKVRIETSLGDITVGLYQADAPKHVENFLKLCREGYYDGTKFHRVMKGFMVQGGDPNSKEEDFTTWGQGGPDYTIEVETNKLYHFKGVLSAAKKDREIQSSGSQFFFTTGESHHLDGQHVVFGAVIEGMEIVTQIEDGEIEDVATSRPVAPVAILSTTVL